MVRESGPSPEEMGLKQTLETTQENLFDYQKSFEDDKDFPQERRKTYLKESIEFVAQMHEQKWETLVFLDRGARSLAGIFIEVWKRLYPEDTVPTIKFMTGGYIGPSQLLKEKFPITDFQGKRVLVVDEQIESGHSFLGAKKSLLEAFPNIKEIKVGTTMDFRNSPMYLPGFSRDDIAIAMRSGLYEIAHRGEKRIKRHAGNSRKEPFVEILPNVDPRDTASFKLRMIGRHETLSEQDVAAVEQRIQATPNEEDKQRLSELSRAYSHFIE